MLYAHVTPESVGLGPSGSRRISRIAFWTANLILFVLLASAFVVPSYTPASNSAKVKIALVAVGQCGPLAGALKKYTLDVGQLPTTSQGLEALYVAPPSAAGKWRGPYLEGTIEELRDLWGAP
ncbi:MAG: type II secretion system protein GspG [Phycisphaerales bacterium]|nr:type II secretion system protein GspG [Phycisphaerales bacterium]